MVFLNLAEPVSGLLFGQLTVSRPHPSPAQSIDPAPAFSRGWIDPQPNLPARIFLLRLLTADDRATERVQDTPFSLRKKQLPPGDIDSVVRLYSTAVLRILYCSTGTDFLSQPAAFQQIRLRFSVSSDHPERAACPPAGWPGVKWPLWPDFGAEMRPVAVAPAPN